MAPCWEVFYALVGGGSDVRYCFVVMLDGEVGVGYVRLRPTIVAVQFYMEYPDFLL